MISAKLLGEIYRNTSVPSKDPVWKAFASLLTAIWSEVCKQIKNSLVAVRTLALVMQPCQTLLALRRRLIRMNRLSATWASPIFLADLTPALMDNDHGVQQLQFFVARSNFCDRVQRVQLLPQLILHLQLLGDRPRLRYLIAAKVIVVYFKEVVLDCILTEILHCFWKQSVQYLLEHAARELLDNIELHQLGIFRLPWSQYRMHVHVQICQSGDVLVFNGSHLKII